MIEPKDLKNPKHPKDLKKDSHDEPGDVRASTFARVDAALRATVATYAATYASYKAPAGARPRRRVSRRCTARSTSLTKRRSGTARSRAWWRCTVAPARSAVDARRSPRTRAQRLRWRRAARRSGWIITYREPRTRRSSARFAQTARGARRRRSRGPSRGRAISRRKTNRGPETRRHRRLVARRFAAAAAFVARAGNARAHVGGAPVTSWLAYNAHYSERYLGAPGAAGRVAVPAVRSAHLVRAHAAGSPSGSRLSNPKKKMPSRTARRTKTHL